MEEEKEDKLETIPEEADEHRPAEQVEGTGDEEATEDADKSSEQEEPPLSDEELSEFIERLCISKAEEFQMLGYPNATGEEVWACVNHIYLKQGVPLLHQIVNDILSLKVTAFMNWLMMEAYRGES